MGQGSDSDADPSALLRARSIHPTGFCDVQSARFGNTFALLHNPKPATALWGGGLEKRIVQNSGSFATKNVFSEGCKTPTEGEHIKPKKLASRDRKGPE